MNNVGFDLTITQNGVILTDEQRCALFLFAKAMSLGHSTLTIKIADGKPVSAEVVEKFKLN